MQPLSRQPPGPRAKRLLELFERLEDADQRTLLRFAEFLAQAEPAAEAPAEPVPEPKPIPRPAEESVVKAIRRLSDTYFMLDKGPLLNETSSLMAQHVMQGRSATEVIDELERLFREEYERLLGSGE